MPVATRSPPVTGGPVVVAVSGAPGSDAVVHRAAELAQQAGVPLLGVHVLTPREAASEPSPLLDRHRRLVVELGGRYHEVVGSDVAGALRGFARAEEGRQLVVGAGRDRGSVVHDLLTDAGHADLVVVAGGRERVRPEPPAQRRRSPTLPPRRRVVAWTLAGGGVPLLTLALLPARDHALPGALLLHLLLVVAVAVIGGARPATAAAVLGFLSVNWFLTPPFHTLDVATAQNLLALFTFLAVGAVVSFLVGQVARGSVEAGRARSEAEALARAAGSLAGSEDPLGALAGRVRSTFELDAVAVLVRSGPGWTVATGAGEPLPFTPEEATSTVPVGDDAVLAVRGGALAADDLRVLRAFAAQLAIALEQRRLEAEAATAAALAEADRLRTALLRSVSHDLRTPLASIKASVSSLLQGDVDWPPDAVEDFLRTIEEETDRLNGLVGNLLDMGRLQAGAVQVSLRPVGLEDVVPAALASLSTDTSAVDLVLDEASPRVNADPVLLERAVANVVSNGLAWAGAEGTVRVEVAEGNGTVELRVVDRGPGVRPEDRSRLFEAFQRLGDRSNDTGAGLGLAVTRGFMEAMGGTVRMEDTPGGGLTVVLGLRAADA